MDFLKVFLKTNNGLQKINIGTHISFGINSLVKAIMKALVITAIRPENNEGIGEPLFALKIMKVLVIENALLVYLYY